MIGRREFITLLGSAAVAWPLPARAQQSAKMLGVGALSAQPRTAPIWLAFEQRMAELGHKQGTIASCFNPFSIAAAIEANDAFIARLQAIRDTAQGLTIEQD